MAKSLIILVMLILIFVFYFFKLYNFFTLDKINENSTYLKLIYKHNPYSTILFFSLIYIFSVSISLPIATILTLLSGFIFGLELGIFIVSISSSFGALISFLIIRYIFYNNFQVRFKKELTKFNENFKKEGAFYIFALRLIPTFPFFLINSLSALLPIKSWTYFWVSFLGMLPATIVYVNAGQQLSMIKKTSDIISIKLFISFCLIGILPIFFKSILKFIKINTKK